jgi:hypothetical protein
MATAHSHSLYGKARRVLRDQRSRERFGGPDFTKRSNRLVNRGLEIVIQLHGLGVEEWQDLSGVDAGDPFVSINPVVTIHYS